MSEDPLQPHSHDNNVLPPGDDASIALFLPDGSQQQISLEALRQLPRTSFAYEYHTDHGVHGPYQLVGVSLRDLIEGSWSERWRQVEVLSADDFGNRIFADEVLSDEGDPILLSYESDGVALRREHGLVRLVVPSETDNALRQVKWVAKIRVLG